MFSVSTMKGVSRSSSAPLHQNESSLGVNFFLFLALRGSCQAQCERCFWVGNVLLLAREDSLANNSFLLVLDSVEG